MFYETIEDLLDVAIAYLRAGLESGEFCLWALPESIAVEKARRSLRRAIAQFDQYLAAGQIEIVHAQDGASNGGLFNPKKTGVGWHKKLSVAAARGYEGMRVCGNAFRPGLEHRKDFYEYERALNRCLAGRKIIALCTHSLHESKAADILDVVRAHQGSFARRNKNWEFVKGPEPNQAKPRNGRSSVASDIRSPPSPDQALLTPRERLTFAHIVKGASSKETARLLGVSPRTVDFHRANIMRKLGVRNTVELVRRALTRL